MLKLRGFCRPMGTEVHSIPHMLYAWNYYSFKKNYWVYRQKKLDLLSYVHILAKK